jgi:hypothetical protein
MKLWVGDCFVRLSTEEHDYWSRQVLPPGWYITERSNMTASGLLHLVLLVLVASLLTAVYMLTSHKPTAFVPSYLNAELDANGNLVRPFNH